MIKTNLLNSSKKLSRQEVARLRELWYSNFQGPKSKPSLSATLKCMVCGISSTGDFSDLCNSGCPVCGSGQVEIYGETE